MLFTKKIAQNRHDRFELFCIWSIDGYLYSSIFTHSFDQNHSINCSNIQTCVCVNTLIIFSHQKHVCFHHIRKSSRQTSSKHVRSTKSQPLNYRRLFARYGCISQAFAINLQKHYSIMNTISSGVPNLVHVTKHIVIFRSNESYPICFKYISYHAR